VADSSPLPKLAVDLGGTHMRCAAVGADGIVLVRRDAPTPHDGRGPEALSDLMGVVHAAMPCRSAVVGVPGRVNYQDGTLEYAPNLPAGWSKAITRASLSAAVGMEVALANDADLAAVGEAWFGAGRSFDDVVYLTLSTGVGAGVVLARRLVHGRRSLIEVGHTIVDLTASLAGEPATLEENASGTAFLRLAAAAGLTGTARELDDNVRRGEPRTVAVWGHVVAAAAAGVVNLAWLFAPEVIGIGGGLGLVGDLLLDPIRATLTAAGPPALDPPIQVLGAALGDDAGLTGAAAWDDAFHPEAAGQAPDQAPDQVLDRER
jgi:glucokinase